MAKSDVAIDPKTGNPIVRTTPEHKLKNVYAKNGLVVVVPAEADPDNATAKPADAPRTVMA